MNENGAGNRFLIRELVRQHDQEPSLKFLIVEGHDDRQIYQWYIDRLSYTNTFVYKIDNVVITKDLLARYDLNGGARDRVITLALELDRRFPERSGHIRCIADSDLDFIEDEGIASNHLLYTDYTCIEMYSCNTLIWTKAFGLGFGYSWADVSNLMETMIPVWDMTFLVRAAYTQLGWPWCFAPLAEFCRVKKKAVIFNDAKFIERSLRDAERIAQWAQLLGVIQELKTRNIDDPRKKIHKDDYLELLGWYLNKRSSWPGYERDGNGIWANLKSALEIENLAPEGLFCEIEEFLTSESMGRSSRP